MTKLAIYVMIVCQSATLVFASELSAQRTSLQEVGIKLNQSGEATLSSLLEEIEAKSHFKFAYSEEEISRQQVYLPKRKWDMYSLLKEMSMQARLSVKRVNHVIALARVPESTPLPEVKEVMRQISGVVVDEENNPLPGATVLVKGTTVGTITDMNGTYNISAPDDATTLIFSFVGYLQEEVPINNQSRINVTLLPDVQSLSEVVVVGFGTQKKVNLTGAVDVVDSERLTNRPIVSTGEGLQGLVPNLNVTVPNGDPSEGAQFNIRGFESINGGAPLVLVDNVPMDINRINPEDIASVTVLKDGAASAVYGARAAFGVILVETKKGKQGININAGAQLSWNRPIWYVEPIKNGYEYALLRNQVQTREGGNAYYDPEYMDRLQAYWEDPENNQPFGVVDGVYEQYGYTGLNEELLNT
ncbi:MAG: carboxypeptidase-like regulatory domain-containing protein, partial [Bacteroidota bacterium]